MISQIGECKCGTDLRNSGTPCPKEKLVQLNHGGGDVQINMSRVASQERTLQSGGLGLTWNIFHCWICFVLV